MSNRQDFIDSLNHKQPLKVPVDFGSTPVTGIHVLCMAGLREYYGLDKKPVQVVEPFQMLGLMEDDLREVMGVTVAGAYPSGNLFGFSNLPPLKEYHTIWGQDVLVPEGFRTKRMDDGSELIYPCGDTSAQPSGRMPAGGYFFDAIIRQKPIDEEKLDYHDNIEEFEPVGDDVLSHLRWESARLSALDIGAISGLPGTALGDIALIPGPNLRDPRGIRDIAEWYISTSARRDYVHEIFEAQTEIALKNLPKIHEALGDRVQAVFVCGTDFGTQTSQFCSSKTFDALYAPYYRRINDWVHAHTGWKTFKHTCGAVVPLLPNIIEAGFDIVNPVQCSAAGMDPSLLKKEFGKNLVFWGGGVDTQHTLPFGTPEQVHGEVLSRCEIFAKDGGFVFNAIHNVQANTPIENVVTMVKAIHEFNGN